MRASSRIWSCIRCPQGRMRSAKRPSPCCTAANDTRARPSTGTSSWHRRGHTWPPATAPVCRGTGNVRFRRRPDSKGRRGAGGASLWIKTRGVGNISTPLVHIVEIVCERLREQRLKFSETGITFSQPILNIVDNVNNLAPSRGQRRIFAHIWRTRHMHAKGAKNGTGTHCRQQAGTTLADGQATGGRARRGAPRSVRARVAGGGAGAGGGDAETAGPSAGAVPLPRVSLRGGSGGPGRVVHGKG